MIAYVVEQIRGYEKNPKTGQKRGRIWWWFFTQPYEFSVWWRPDGTKTMDQFLQEQVVLVREYLSEHK